MSDSTNTPPSSHGTESPGRFLIVQPAGAGLTMMVDTMTGRSWFRIAAGTDHYAWRPMKFEPSAAEVPR
jgi:hypothetical protein